MSKKRRTTRKGLTRGQDFNPDYSYVIQDLRRIGFLTAAFVGLLVILSFILR